MGSLGLNFFDYKMYLSGPQTSTKISPILAKFITHNLIARKKVAE
jgi:hypothetical protein